MHKMLTYAIILVPINSAYSIEKIFFEKLKIEIEDISGKTKFY